MKLVFNTHSTLEASSLFYTQNLRSFENVQFSDWQNYQNYDVAIFMQHERDVREIEKARRINPNLIIGIADPRGKSVIPYVKMADFCLVNSIEKRDYFLAYQRQIHIYHEYPLAPKSLKHHLSKDKIVLGYHGNKVHLSALFPEITGAIEELNKLIPVELHAVYNIHELGLWRVGQPKNVVVKHVQWSLEELPKALSQMDIGLVPAFQPIAFSSFVKRIGSVSKKYFVDREEDYLLRFKVPTNPGRIIIFANNGIPVVSDFFPSACDFIRHGQSGYLACRMAGWFYALKELSMNPELRNQLAKNLQQSVAMTADPQIQNDKLRSFLLGLEKNTKQNLSVEICSSVTLWSGLKYRVSIFYDLYWGRHQRRILKLKKLLGIHKRNAVK